MPRLLVAFALPPFITDVEMEKLGDWIIKPPPKPDGAAHAAEADASPTRRSSSSFGKKELV